MTEDEREALAAIEIRDTQSPDFWFARPAHRYGLREQHEAYAVQDRRQLLQWLKEFRQS